MTKTLRCRIPLGSVLPSIGMMISDRRRRFSALPVYREKRRGNYETLSWEGLYARVSRVGASLIERGLKKGEVAAIYSRNREEMLVFELAAMSIGAIAAPIFSEYPAYQLDYVLGHARPKFLAVSDEAHLKVVLRTRAAKKIKRIFVMDEFRRRPGKRLAEFGELYGDSGSFDEFKKRVRRARPKDACLLMYTSGTTGRPKGVLLCHENILSQRKAMDLLWNLKPGGRVLSYLPWHHSFGGIYELFGALYSGACLTLDESYGKDLGLLIRNFKRVKPTIYFSVPRIHQALVEEAQVSKKAEKEIFHKDLRFVFTAAAALPKHVSDFYAQKGVPVVEGWGLTETAPCVTVTRFGHQRRPGAVGKPIPGVAVRIASDGEILVKGPNVMLGYYRDRKLTREAVRRGWFHTGDFGALRGYGLVLECRKDGMFKLSNGERVISQVVENALAASPLIQYAVAVGSGKDFVAALIFPNLRALGEAARRRGYRTNGGNLLNDKRIRGIVQSEVAKFSLCIGEKYARPKALILSSREPSLANGELTPTMKVVRSKVAEDYARDIEAVFCPDKFTRAIIRL